MVTIDSVQTSLRTADDWQKKGQPAWTLKCVSSALMGYLQIAVNEQSDPVSGAAWLASQSFASVLQRQLDTLDALVVEVTAGRLPSAVIGGNYHPLVFAHAAWCVQEFDLGESFVTFSDRKDVGNLGTPFWREYAASMGALVRQENHHPKELRLRGQENYWMAYLRLIEAVCNAQPIESAVTEIDNLFAQRNRDTTIKDDAYQIEGSGLHPVKWDFRRQGILSYIEHRQ